MAALVGVVAFYLIQSGDNGLHEPDMDGVEAGEGLKLKDIHYTHDDADEGMKWILDAEEVSFSSDRNSMVFRDFKLRVEPESEQWVEMKGNRGEYSRDSGDIKLWGDLVGRSQGGYRFSTERLHINEKTRQARTDDVVEITGPLFSVRGKGLFADLNEERVEILSDVTSTLKQEAWEQ
ncbi:MAG: LPS export ABC transporter periplasmic protein LptC [Deltaproteobacteria bacterium]|nr:LPS export ABC transporter periplasmic protein LptC [Deltaproteobacteria bacterium]MBW1816483.1 LPS export ABC transporter periplasmic protein LptC [Deltaproteobacteria bacterium]